MKDASTASAAGGGTMVEPAPDLPVAVRYHSEEGFRYGVRVSQSPYRIVFLASSGGVLLRRLGPDEQRRCTELHDYPPRRAIRKMFDSGRTLGIGKRARKALKASRRVLREAAA